VRKIVAVGFVIWLGATVALRLVGQFVFPEASVAGPLVLLLVTLPLMVLVTRAVLAGVRDRALGAIALVAPGMLLDTFSTIWFARVFPNMRADTAPMFGGWLLFCNVVVLLTAALWRPAQSARDASPVSGAVTP
jgi:hypothetical protein